MIIGIRNKLNLQPNITLLEGTKKFDIVSAKEMMKRREEKTINVVKKNFFL
jgi:hypothetical protein